MTRLSPILCLLVVLLSAACERSRPTPTPPAPPLPPPVRSSGPMLEACDGPPTFAAAAQANAASLTSLAWAPFRRPEVGWEAYVPVISRLIATACPPQSPGFAQAMADWQRGRGLPADGLMTDSAFEVFKGLWQERRPFVMATLDKQCPDAPPVDTLASAAPAEGYASKPIQLRPGALEAYRRVRDAARREVPEAATDPQLMTIFSGFRDPAADEARCQAEGNCQGITRARCSAHRTGLAMDLTLGAAPELRPDDASDPNRLYLSKTPLYLWLVANADRFDLVNYWFEPWHWEWTGEAPLPMTDPPPGFGNALPAAALAPVKTPE